MRPYLVLVPLLTAALLAAELLFTGLGGPGLAQVASDLVNPLVGTAADGQTFPAAGVPFAMTDWTPQTRDGETKCIAPYYAGDTRLQGFRGSHFMSGSCTQDYGSLTVMPVSGPLKLAAQARASGFTHADEQAHPYGYSVDLESYGIHADVTGTVRSGFMRFRYNRAGPAWLVIQTNNRPEVSTGGLHIDQATNEVSGENPAYRLYAGEGKPAGFSGYFVLEFDHPIHTPGYWDTVTGRATSNPARGAWLSFDLHPGEQLQVRIGTSFTSVDEARRNLHAEIPEWNFDQTEAAAKAAWEQILGSIAIAGHAPERHIFYTAMYHALLLPRTYSDQDGTYPRFASQYQTAQAHGFTYYDDFSLWDTFRALHPMLTILDPAREGDMIASLVAKGAEGGVLPIFPAWNSYTSEMVGDHADAAIADAYAKGVRNFDVAQAYQLMRRNASETPPPPEYEDGRGRRALDSYLKYGYIPLEDHVPFAFHKDEQVSRTLEYAYDDWLVSSMAAALGHPDDAARFAKQARNWQNVIDPAAGFARGRHADGSWVTPFNPGEHASWITEGLPFQYTFFVPQDIPGLVDALGGRSAFIAKLDTLFAKGYYEQGNEPSHHIAYLYDQVGAAAKTQQHVRAILDTQYADRPDGLPGNDDGGQMSAWYVMSALGFYPITPGVPQYAIGTPRFDDVTISIPNGRKLHILAKGAESGRFYIRSMRLNGSVLDRPYLLHTEVMGGGELVFEMSRQPAQLAAGP
jgi:predicted alpha-1,2-mannosidase